MNTISQRHAERAALRLRRRHYENFPVASLLLPRTYRAPVALLYAFARRADDLADEGDFTPDQRLQNLARLRQELDRAREGAPCDDETIAALAQVMERFALPWQPLYDLLTAFARDVTVSRYPSFEALAAYCALSANPIGQLLLHLYRSAEAEHLARSDALCTALQLINFLQDLDEDYRKRGRIYVPLDEMTRFGVTEEHFRRRTADDAMRALLAFQVERARTLLERGAPLGGALPGRLGLELRAVITGGRRILDKLGRRPDPFIRPRLHGGDWLAVICGAVRPAPFRASAHRHTSCE